MSTPTPSPTRSLTPGDAGEGFRHYSPERLAAMCDGVFGVAITLLVMTLDLPKPEPGVAAPPLGPRLLAMWPQFETYVICFALVGLFWKIHHNLLTYVKDCDQIFIFLHLFLLLFISFLPFATNVGGDYPLEPAGTICFLGTLALTCGALSLIWSYAAGHRRLLRPDLPEALIRALFRIQWIVLGLLLACLPLMLIDLRLARWASLVTLCARPLLFARMTRGLAFGSSPPAARENA
ncbi:MAG: DUF1211 domain-containing protein [Planctomycetes bacterium]|nr:DUF1211 domain-containing protein [Planctomycetota bacterium]